MTVKILTGDCREVLKTLPYNSVQCCVTSPPYFGLRDYGVDGQIGLEATPEEYVAELVAVFQEVRSVLHPTGCVFLNLGDTYASNRGYQVPDNKYHDVGNSLTMRVPGRLKPKDLIGIPWRCAFALQDDGWWLRSEITWAKVAPMPESVQDRPTSATEKIFLLTKSANYFYDVNAVREPCAESTIKDGRTERATRGKTGVYSAVDGNCGYNPSGRNLRNFWLLGPDPYPGSHFAVMPRRIPEIAILAGTSEKGCCAKCGAPWQRIVEKGLTAHDGQTQSAYPKSTTSNRLALLRQAARERGEEYVNQSRTTGWQPTCACNAETVPCVVLDPFGGSGTTGQVAERLGRNSILIELNPYYIDLIKKRTSQSGLTFI